MGEIAAEVGVGDEISVSCRVALLDDSGHWRSPLVVAPGVQESLIDCSADEVFLVIAVFLHWKISDVKHIGQRVFVVLEPELISPLDVPARSIRV